MNISNNDTTTTTTNNNNNNNFNNYITRNHLPMSNKMIIMSREVLHKVLEGFGSLKGSPTELWRAYTLKFLDSYAYFSLSVVFTLFLSNDFGYTDYEAGTIYGGWGALVTLFGLASGPIIDKLGVSACLKLGFLISFIARCGLFITSSRLYMLLSMTLLSFGNCLGIPVLTVGIRRYTNETNRGFAFGLFYVIMNVAALLSGPTVDLCTIYFENERQDGNGQGNENDNGNANGRRLEEVADDGDITPEWSFTGYRLIILIGIIANIVACLISLSVKEIKVSTPPKVPQDNTRSSSNSNSNSPQHQHQHQSSSAESSTGTETFQISNASTMEILRETMQSPDFWRFLVVCIITLNIRMIFRHLDATLPKYMIREFGENVPKGTIYSINPALIMILVPIITAATTKVNPLTMIHHGCYVSAISVFFLVISTSITSCVLFVVVLSIGEAIWSPRLYDYTMQIAKEGREGTYMALSSAPLFLAKLPVGMMSGYLLQKYCPEDGPRNSKLMWLIIGLTTAVSPILMTVCWGYISKQSNDTTTTQDYNEVLDEDDSLPLNELAPIRSRKGHSV